MTEQEKQLLSKDLCARLPHGMYAEVEIWNGDKVPKKVYGYNQGYFRCDDNDYDPDEIKPFLRPMSSMTKEEKGELLSQVCGEGVEFFHVAENGIYNNDDVQQFGSGWEIHWVNYQRLKSVGFPAIRIVNFTNENTAAYTDWLNVHHFDYRGLIPMGLALEAPEGMYKN